MGSESKFGPQHHNAIAKDIRGEMEIHVNLRTHHQRIGDGQRMGRETYSIDALVKLALRLAFRFKADNDSFDPLKFLDQCSPDPDTMPLSELWEGYDEERVGDGKD